MAPASSSRTSRSSMFVPPMILSLGCYASVIQYSLCVRHLTPCFGGYVSPVLHARFPGRQETHFQFLTLPIVVDGRGHHKAEGLCASEHADSLADFPTTGCKHVLFRLYVSPLLPLDVHDAEGRDTHPG